MEYTAQDMPTLSNAKIGRASLTERLNAQKEEHTRRLEEINTVLKTLEENPKLQEVLDQLTKYGLY